MDGEINLILSVVLLGMIVVVLIAVLILTRFIQQLESIINSLNPNCKATSSFRNSVNDSELNQKESATTGFFRKRPMSGMSPWMKGSMESVVDVPSRQESPKERFLLDDNVLDMRTVSFETFQIPHDN